MSKAAYALCSDKKRVSVSNLIWKCIVVDLAILIDFQKLQGFLWCMIYLIFPYPTRVALQLGGDDNDGTEDDYNLDTIGDHVVQTVETLQLWAAQRANFLTVD